MPPPRLFSCSSAFEGSTAGRSGFFEITIDGVIITSVTMIIWMITNGTAPQ